LVKRIKSPYDSVDLLWYYISIMSSPDSHSHVHHNHASDAHAHHGIASGRIAIAPAWSLLRISAFERLLLAGGMLALLWLAVIAVMN
jgi:hypothetical protein